ncbi:N-acetylglucosamine kinase [Herbiconiux sp. P16]|uniref:N-acetylglucosamine kinase n=1 Tax=Herbiconiux wuyangfengii TaxID=3342794 RepID=UPI0035BB2FDE
MSTSAPAGSAAGARWVLGLDVGGSGSRIALAVAGDGAADAPKPPLRVLQGSRVGIAARGSSIPEVVDALLVRAETEWASEWGSVSAIAVGATGAFTLVADPDAVVRSIAARRPGAIAALATDAVTAHLGALAGSAGAVVAVGTGSVALGTDLGSVWRRVDGWGHLLGDRGAGSWIGREGLEAAMRQFDGVTSAAGALLAAAIDAFGSPEGWPAQLYTRDDRAGVLGSFAGRVHTLAAAGDPAAVRIMTEAGREVARTLVAALDPRLPRIASAVGGVFAAPAASPLQFAPATGAAAAAPRGTGATSPAAGASHGATGAFTEAFTAAVREAHPPIELRPPAGTPLDGAIRLARLLTSPTPPSGHPEHLWLATP